MPTQTFAHEHSWQHHSQQLQCGNNASIQWENTMWPIHKMESFFKVFIYLFLGRGKGREKERERNIHVWLPLTCPFLGTWPATQACALTGNSTGDPLVCRLVLKPLSYTSQGSKTLLYISSVNLDLRVKKKIIPIS